MLSKINAYFFHRHAKPSAPSMVKGYIYTRAAAEDPRDSFWHGALFEITEIFIPSHGVILNSMTAVFSADEPVESSDLSSVYLSIEFADRIKQIARRRTQLEEGKKSLTEEFGLEETDDEKRGDRTPVVSYTIKVAPSAFQGLRGGHLMSIKEFFIPSLQIIYNIVDGQFNLFKETEPRETTGQSLTSISTRRADQLRQVSLLNDSTVEDKTWLTSCPEFNKLMNQEKTVEIEETSALTMGFRK